MANHTAVKVGGWAFREKLTATQITGIQERLLKCPNFSEGSTHSLTGDLNINAGGGSIYVYAPVTLGADGNARTTIGGRRNYPIGVKSVSASFQIKSTDAFFSWWLATVGSGYSATFIHSGFIPGDVVELFNYGASALDIRDETLGSFATLLAGKSALFRYINSSLGFRRVLEGTLA